MPNPLWKLVKFIFKMQLSEFNKVLWQNLKNTSWPANTCLIYVQNLNVLYENLAFCLLKNICSGSRGLELCVRWCEVSGAPSFLWSYTCHFAHLACLPGQVGTGICPPGSPDMGWLILFFPLQLTVQTESLPGKRWLTLSSTKLRQGITVSCSLRPLQCPP